jgi:hypothetical protein
MPIVLAGTCGPVDGMSVPARTAWALSASSRPGSLAKLQRPDF